MRTIDRAQVCVPSMDGAKQTQHTSLNRGPRNFC
jgi:hypothetical protein